MDYFAFADANFGQGLIRTVIGTSAQENSYTSTTFGGAGAPVYVSAPVVDKNGYAYMTVTDATLGDSAIECVQDSVSSANRRVRWRFRLPSAAETNSVDASGVSYTALQGYHFIGAPVVDRNGFVYALAAAATGSAAAVLCFDTNKTVSADLFGANGTPTGEPSPATRSHSLEATSGTSEVNQACPPCRSSRGCSSMAVRQRAHRFYELRRSAVSLGRD